MRELNVSTFIQVMQIGLKKHDTQFAAGTFPLEALNQSDAQAHAEYISQKIKDCELENHAFYFYLLPLNDAENEKKTIMQHVLEGDADLCAVKREHSVPPSLPTSKITHI